MATMEVTYSVDPNREYKSKLLALRVTPEQEIAIHAFYEINKWTLITEEVQKTCLQCQCDLKGEDYKLRCLLCQRAVDSDGQIHMKDSETQTDIDLASQDQDLKMFLIGNDLNGQTPKIVYRSIDEQTENRGAEVLYSANTSTSDNPQILEIVKKSVPQDNLTEIQESNTQSASEEFATAVQVIKNIHVGSTNDSSENNHYKCDFHTKSDMNDHMKFHDSKTASPEHDVCGEEVMGQCDLRFQWSDHVEEPSRATVQPEKQSHTSVHSEKETFQCTLCSKTFHHRGHLRLHMKAHKTGPPYKCEICNKELRTSGILRKHLKIHSGEKPYKCDTCSKCFRTNTHLKNHSRTHSGERPFKCAECGRAFTQDSHLVAHYRTHTGEKPFKCDQCPKSFKNGKTLKKHKLVHIQGKSLSCKICGKDFFRSTNLETHMTVHSKKNWYITEKESDGIKTNEVEVKMEYLDEKGN